jgi:hypothetical protein
MAETTRKFPPSTPREFLRACRKTLGDTYLMKLFKSGTRERLEEDSAEQEAEQLQAFQRRIQRWTQGMYADQASFRRNYIEHHEQILTDLMQEAGGPEIARALVSRHAEIVGCTLILQGPLPIDHNEDIRDKILDTDEAAAILNGAMRRWVHPDKIRHLVNMFQYKHREMVAHYRAVYDLERREQLKASAPGSSLYEEVFG